MLCNAPPDAADVIARTLVLDGLAACISMSPVRSVYQWEGELCCEEEVSLTIKTKNADRLRERLLELHPYDVPEVLVVAVDEAKSHKPYVDWVSSVG